MKRPQAFEGIRLFQARESLGAVDELKRFLIWKTPRERLTNY